MTEIERIIDELFPMDLLYERKVDHPNYSGVTGTFNAKPMLANAIEQYVIKAMESLQLCTRKDCDKGKALSPDGSSSVVDCPECEGRGFKNNP